MSRCDQPAGRFIPVIDPNKCEGKGPCIAACPYGVLNMGVLSAAQRQQLTLLGKIKGWVHGWRQAQVVAVDLCQACNACVIACPEQAIRLVPNRPPRSVKSESAD